MANTLEEEPLTDTLNDLLSNYSAEVQNFSLKLREPILGVVPGAQDVCVRGGYTDD